jgi:hypothetical protein
MLSAIALDSGSGIIKELRERSGYAKPEDLEGKFKKVMSCD